MSKAVAQVEPQPIAAASDPSRLLELAVQQNLDVEKLGKLMELSERWQAQQAKVAFNQSLAKFQSLCPSMRRNKKGHNGSYATLDEIRTTTRPILEQCALISTFVYGEAAEGEVKVGCKISHISGHSEVNWLSGPYDISGNKNEIQSRGSTVSYLQRYTMIGALGITSADEDSDGDESGGPVVYRILAHIKWARENRPTVNAIISGINDGPLEVASEAWFELPNEEKMVANLAPSKGGVFTTEELRAMRTTEFRESFYGVTKSNSTPAAADANNG